MSLTRLPRPQLIHETSAAALHRALDLSLGGCCMLYRSVQSMQSIGAVMTKCTNLIGLSELIPLIEMVPAVPKCSYEERILGGIGKIDENPGIYIYIYIL